MSVGYGMKIVVGQTDDNWKDVSEAVPICGRESHVKEELCICVRQLNIDR